MEKSRPTTAQRINQLFFRKAVRFAKHVIANKEWKRQWQRNAQLKKGEVFRDAIKVFMVELGRKKEKVILQPDRVVFKSMRWFPRVKPRGYVFRGIRLDR